MTHRLVTVMGRWVRNQCISVLFAERNMESTNALSQSPMALIAYLVIMEPESRDYFRQVNIPSSEPMNPVAVPHELTGLFKNTQPPSRRHCMALLLDAVFIATWRKIRGSSHGQFKKSVSKGQDHLACHRIVARILCSNA